MLDAQEENVGYGLCLKRSVTKNRFPGADTDFASTVTHSYHYVSLISTIRDNLYH